MKLQIAAAAALIAVAAAPHAQACNPLLARNYGQHVAPTVLPAEMLAPAYPATAGQPSIVGLWHDVHTAADGTLFLEGYDTWNSDGTENELGNLPPATGPICVGAWKLRGNHVELLTHVAWTYDLNNNFTGTLNITEQNRVLASGNKYTGTFNARFYDTTGALVHEVTGTTTADRLGK